MSVHPARLMLYVWLLCALTFVALPYQLVEQPMTTFGAAVFLAFLLCFVLGTLLVPSAAGRQHVMINPVELGSASAQRLLATAAIGAIIGFALDIKDKNVFDLTLAYELRSESATALLNSEASNSSLWFQLAFLLYPAAFVYIVAHLIYAKTIRLWKLVVFGFLPVIMATLAMGGRVPVFYALIAGLLAFRERKKYVPSSVTATAAGRLRMRVAVAVGLSAVCAVLLYYFASVFFIRAQVVGGAAAMFDLAEANWGVGFHGTFSSYIFDLFGDDLTYLIFIFIWYLVQGLVMANYLFTGYDGPMQLGVYGLDLMSALMRRLDPQRVAQGFDSLLSLGTYGFLPSAFGSLYVDLGFLGLLACIAWGYACAVVYRRIAFERSARWLLLGPFITMGIVFSVINTPLGFTNGLVTHAWMLAAFLLLKRSRIRVAKNFIDSK